MKEIGTEEQELQVIVALFFDGKTTIQNTINTSHGEHDFREAVFVQTESSENFVIKLADNDFTFPEKVQMWQRCSESYRSVGYYAPAILSSKTGDFPTVQYKGRTCVAYAEEFSKYACDNDAGNGIASSKYRDEILIMTAKIANLYSDYAEYPSGYCLFELFSPSDQHDEVMDNALTWKHYAEMLPAEFQTQVHRIWNLWYENRCALQKIYHQLPTSVFQADLNSSNSLVDENGNFIGVYDFNLSGKDVLLNYLIREIGWQDDETELNIIKSAIDTVGKVYTFSALEKQAAPMLYRCIKPLWYTKIQRLKAAGDDQTAIQACLDKTESMLTKTINFFA